LKKFATALGGRIFSLSIMLYLVTEMFQSENDIPPFNRIINAIHEMMLNKIITSDKELHVRCYLY